LTVRLTRSPAGFRAALLVVAVSLVPLPLAAADHVAGAQAQPLKASIAKHAAQAAVAAPKPAASRTQARHQTADPRTGGFFHSGAGIACMAVIAAGTGYAIYSASHDRIHSVARSK
jgi:hypothetical protein